MVSRLTTHKVIALISGGKDSFLSILQCQTQGHEIVALANLYPPSSVNQDEDLNSYMYQTAGHALIPFYEEATGIPLYRLEIKGTTSQLDREYDVSKISSDTSSYDETEDLTTLLRSILERHSEADAVCSGAILSTYQRTRIEDVCLRLKLKPLAYLWQMSFLHPSVHENASILEKSSALLDHITAMRLDARIVKVASGGLDESFLWQSLLEQRTRQRVKSAMKRFGGSVVGEGGEFETLVLSGPRPLFRGRIVVPDSAVIVKSGQGGEVWVDLDTAQVRVEPLDNNVGEAEAIVQEFYRVKPEFASASLAAPVQLRNTIDNRMVAVTKDIKTRPAKIKPFASTPWHGSCCEANDLVYYNNYTTSSASLQSCAEQTQDIMNQIKTGLSARGLVPANLVFVVILLHSMEDFAEMNAAYVTFFESPLPPARVTVAIGANMPNNRSVAISAIAYPGDLIHKKGLHVQSISHWAPANIGPYSQATSVLIGESQNVSLIFIAGQIPLVPNTMQPRFYRDETPEEAFREQATLALRHATRIGKDMSVTYFTHAVAFICQTEDISAAERAKVASAVWSNLHNPSEIEEATEENQFDAWDLKYGGQGSLVNDEENLQRNLPSMHALQKGSNTVPGFLAVQVEDLPRSQTIEWHVMGYAGGQVMIEKDTFACNVCAGVDDEPVITVSVSARHSISPVGSPTKLSDDITAVRKISSRTVYVTGKRMAEFTQNSPSDVLVPCHRVWGIPKDSEKLEEVDCGIVSLRTAKLL